MTPNCAPTAGDLARKRPLPILHLAGKACIRCRLVNDYAAIGNATNLAARLCSEAAGGEILAAPRVVAALADTFDLEPAGQLTLKGLHRAPAVTRIVGQCG